MNRPLTHLLQRILQCNQRMMFDRVRRVPETKYWVSNKISNSSSRWLRSEQHKERIAKILIFVMGRTMMMLVIIAK